MAGTPLQNFNDFMATTGPRYLTSAQAVVNEAVKQTYVYGRFLKGRGMDEVIQGGKTINDVIMFDDARTYDHYNPNQNFTWENPQVTDTITVSWRFSIDHMSWTDHEIELNIGEGLSREAAKAQYKNLKRIKEQRMWTSMINGFEEDLWAAPANQQAQMETATGKLPYSIPAFITEDTTDYHATGWSTVEGLDPASESKWRNQVSTYDHTDPDDTDGDGDALIHAFDDMWSKVRFVPPVTQREYFENDKLNKQFICTSRQGLNLIKRLLRDSNDRLITPQDAAYNSPKYSGIDILYVAQLDAATLYTGAVEASNEPRYYWLNGNYIKPIFHSRRYFQKHEPMRHPNQPFTWVCPVDTWWNLFLASRQRQGIVAPASPSN